MNKFLRKVFMWMFIGLFLSGITAYFTSINKELLMFVARNYTFIIILEFALVIIISLLRKKLPPAGVTILFLLYSLASGFTLSSIFLIFNIKTLFVAFASSSVLFLLLALYGYNSKQDLSSFGRIMFIGLISVIIVTVINIFLRNTTLNIILSIVSILVFLGLTAYDMQTLKKIYNYYGNNEKELSKASIYGALDLYLDFINIFIRLLNMFGGGSKD